MLGIISLKPFKTDRCLFQALMMAAEAANDGSSGDYSQYVENIRASFIRLSEVVCSAPTPLPKLLCPTNP